MSDKSDLSEADVFLHPPWREAVRRFLGSGFKPGDVVPFAWLFEAFRIAMPDRNREVGAVCDKLKLQFLGQFEPFQRELLEEHQIDLANERGVGYRLVPPKEQTKVAYEDGVADLRKAVRRMGARLVNVDMVQLGASERKENADALARLSMLTGMMKQVRKVSFLEEPGDKEAAP